MVVFLADRFDIQARQLHRRIRNRFRTDGYFETVQLRVAEPREPGPYRVVARTNPRLFLDDEGYPTRGARIEVGFDLDPGGDHDHYWVNWIEPDRSFLLGWHQDDDHPNLGPVHLQVNKGGEPIEHRSATFVDAHPMAALDARLDQLPVALARVEWRDGSAVGLTR